MAYNDLPDKVKGSLLDFFSVEIADKMLSGITYSILLKNQKQEAIIKSYMQLKKDIEEVDRSNAGMLRVFELCNGYIFDLSVKATQQLALDILRSTCKQGEEVPQSDINNLNSIYEARKESLRKLAIKCFNEFNSREDKTKTSVDIDVALYSRNITPYISFMATDKKSKDKYLIKYDAFALKHTDLEELNRAYLLSKRLKVSVVKPLEVLTTRTGVLFRLTVEKLDPNMTLVR